MSRRVAFLWGSNGNNDFSRLHYAEDDVKRLETTLSSSRYGFEVIKPKDTSDPHKIHAALLDATSSCTRDDVFIGYFSGHGHLVGSKLHLVLDKSVPGATKTMFSSAWLLDALNGCQASQRLLILDCCHAGAATGIKGMRVDVTALFPDHRDERILYASGKLEAARELAELNGSFLTHRLCEELNGAPPGEVPLSRIVSALERAADERNQYATLQKRVPVPFLSGVRQPEFYFTAGRHDDPPPPGSVQTPRQPLPISDNMPRHSLSSVWIGLRAAASDGQGAYVSTMLAFGLAAFFFHDSLALQHRGHDDLQKNIQQVQDPLRATRFPNFESLVLPRKEELCSNKFLTLLTEIRLEQAYLTFIEDRNNPRQPSRHHDKFTLVMQRPNAGIDLWQDVALNDWPPSYDQLWIPSVLGNFLQPNASLEFCQAQKEQDSQQQRLCHAMDDSLAIGGLSAYLDKDITDGSGQSYHVNTLYYVSPEGVIRAIGAPPILLNDLKNSPVEAGSLCGNEILHSVTITSTRPHFDLARRGIVETTCYQTDESTKPPYGRLCAEVSVPEAAIFSRLRKAEAELKITTIRLPFALDDAACSNQRALCDEKLPGTADKDADGLSAKMYYQRHLNNQAHVNDAEDHATGTRGVWSESESPGVLGAVVFHRPTGRATPAEYWDVAIARIRDPRTPNYFSLTLSAAGLTAAVGLLVRSFRRKLKREQSLLARGLQYGLLELSDGRRIVGANDRAEEILGERLPKLGIQSGQFQSGITFSPMISDVCVLLPSHGAAPSEADICSYDGKIRDRAADGLTSVFYAWVKRRQMWIKVTSTVIWLPDDTEHVFCALDTAIDRLHMDLLAAARNRSTRQETEDYAIVAV